ncbi:alginate lyase domain-containing protein [Hirsutella rhossiliensis]|uniref:Alginate lyase domain-containing protein n=1 Tax=Hirsutella rhossiliensis TaxID=111463 RepID=A0A9P8MZW9_9HYPO|nr:alginate lyase domain-containing protein [Hirsutella rhossiliensis]KAH0964299.1 alginate lyase domain-containing protein [Hirsutella rhossiliensis]
MNCAPGGNFDLGAWNLQLPTGSNGFDVVRSKDLQGCEGYSDQYFSTDSSSGTMVFVAPGNPRLTGCVTTPGSSHCRTELREVNKNDGRNAAWNSRDTNVLEVTMAVTKADDGTYGTAIGQVFAQAKPLAAIYYSQQGNITFDIKPGPQQDTQRFRMSQVPLGKQFTYKLSYSSDILSVAVDGIEAPLNFTAWPAQDCSFKLGNYNQGRSGDRAEVHVAAIHLQHDSLGSATFGLLRKSLYFILPSLLVLYCERLARSLFNKQVPRCCLSRAKEEKKLNSRRSLECELILPFSECSRSFWVRGAAGVATEHDPPDPVQPGSPAGHSP